MIKMSKKAVVSRSGVKVLETEMSAPPPVTPEEARSKRNTLLAASDWTQVADAPVDQAAWATYRQALRDVTDQVGFPENVTWPIAPE